MATFASQVARMIRICRVGSDSDPASVGGSLARRFRQDGIVAVRTIGAGALNQATKSVAIARQHLSQEGVDLCSVISFATVYIEGEEKTAILQVLTHRVEDPARPTPQFILVERPEAEE